MDTFTKQDIVRGLRVYFSKDQAVRYADSIIADSRSRKKEPTDELSQSILETVKDKVVVHHCPEGDEGFTQCCDRSPLELPRAHRLTLDPVAVTCKGK